jgi:hypothetical protein
MGRISGMIARLGRPDRLNRIGARRTMSLTDGLRFIAAFFTLLTFVQAAVAPMRLAAIGANVSFIAYGVFAGSQPVLVLHLILLPVNAYRLWTSFDLTAPAERERANAPLAGASAGLV